MIFRQELKTQLEKRLSLMVNLDLKDVDDFSTSIVTSIYQVLEKMHSGGNWPPSFPFPKPSEVQYIGSRLITTSGNESRDIFYIGDALNGLMPFNMDVDYSKKVEETKQEEPSPRFMGRLVEWQ